VLDGLLYHQSDLQIEEHYPDTAGFTDHVFALCHLLGFRFVPRIRDLADPTPLRSRQRKYVPRARESDRRNAERQANGRSMERDPIKRGTVTASLILRKLGAYPRQNSLALAHASWGALSGPYLRWNGSKVRSCAAGCMWV